MKFSMAETVRWRRSSECPRMKPMIETMMNRSGTRERTAKNEMVAARLTPPCREYPRKAVLHAVRNFFISCFFPYYNLNGASGKPEPLPQGCLEIPPVILRNAPRLIGEDDDGRRGHGDLRPIIEPHGPPS